MDTNSDARHGAGAEPTSILTACLTAVVAIVPAVFWVEVEETFAIPKLVALVAIVATGVVALATMLPTLRFPRQLHVVDAAVGAFAVLVAISFVGSIDRDLSLWGERLQRQGLLPTLVYVLFYGFARLAITDGRRLRLIVRAASAGATFVAGYAIIQRIGLDPIWTTLPQGRVFSTIGQSNALGGYLAMAVPLAIASATVEHRLVPRGIWLIAIAIQSVALFFTLSRGAYLAAAVALAVGFLPAVLAGIRDHARRTAAVVTGAVAVVAVVAVTFVPTFAETGERAIARTFSTEDVRTGSIRDHLDLWTVAIHVTAEHPALGTGPDTYPLAFDDYRDEVLDPDRAQRFAPYRVESPHNIFLGTAAGSGVAAALALAAAFIGGIYSSLRLRGAATDESERLLVRATGSALLAYVIANSFITAELAGSSTAWILLGSVVAFTTRRPTDLASPAGRGAARPGAGTVEDP